jgi:hypothetical protein
VWLFAGQTQSVVVKFVFCARWVEIGASCEDDGST